MAAVVATKPPAPSGKMKKPSAPFVHTSVNGVKPVHPSSSPSSATKKLPGQTPTPSTTTNNAATVNGVARNPRRPPRITKPGTTDSTGMDRRIARKYPEPYVSSEAHILKKFKGRTPSLIVHLHPTHFRFDQQDGSFSYHSEMRLFIEHLNKKTIPHDMLEELRKSDVQFYDGWLIVRVVDHKTVAKAAASKNAAAEDEKAGSIHNYTPYITPSPYAPWPNTSQISTKSPRLKQENGPSSSSQTKSEAHAESNGETRDTDTFEYTARPKKPQPRVFHVALRPTNLSRHMDLVIDAMTPDPKAMNRRQSQASFNPRMTGSGNGPPPTPLSTVPSTPSIEKGPPLKKQKMKIESKDLLEYEAKVINATAPPLYLEAVETLEEVQGLLEMLKDPLHDCEPPSPKSRKRTVAELAADDALAKGQERYMRIMDESSVSASSGVAAGAVDGQSSSGLFQPDFAAWLAIKKIKEDIKRKEEQALDKKQAEDLDRRTRQEQEEYQRLQTIELRRRQMQIAEQNRQRVEAAKTQQQHLQQQQQQQQQLQQQHQLAQQQQQQQQRNQQQVPHSSMPINGVPPSMQNQVLGHRSSPGRQGTPSGSSPIVPHAAQPARGDSMAATASNPGIAGSPPRPGSAVQHAHPAAAMARGPSGQGPSRNGTPQIPNSTPGMMNATPVLLHQTPVQRMTQASPHVGMVAHTPQMAAIGMGGPGQMTNGVPMNAQQAQQLAAIHQQQLQRQAAVAQQNMANGNPPSTQAILAHQQAQRQAHLEQQMLQHQQQQQQMHQQQQHSNQVQQMAHAAQPHPSQSPAAQQQAYRQAMAAGVQAQMQRMQNGQPQGHGSPAPNPQQTPQQQAAQLHHMQAQQRQQVAMQQAQAQQQHGQIANGVPHQQAQPQGQRQPNPLMQQFFENNVKKLMNQRAAQQYGGNIQAIPQHEAIQIRTMAMKQAQIQLGKQQQLAAQMRQQQSGQGQGQGQANPNMAAMIAQQQALMHQQQQPGQQHPGNPNMQQVQNALMQQQQIQNQMQARAIAQLQQQGHGGNMPGAGGQGGQVPGHPGLQQAQAQAQAQALMDKQAYQQQLQHMLAQQNMGQQQGQGQ